MSSTASTPEKYQNLLPNEYAQTLADAYNCREWGCDEERMLELIKAAAKENPNYVDVLCDFYAATRGSRPVRSEGGRLSLKDKQIKKILLHRASPTIPQYKFCEQLCISQGAYWRVVNLRYVSEKDRNRVIAAGKAVGYEFPPAVIGRASERYMAEFKEYTVKTTNHCTVCGKCFGKPCAPVLNLARSISNEADGTLRAVTMFDGAEHDSSTWSNSTDAIITAIIQGRFDFGKAPADTRVSVDMLYPAKDGEKRVTVLSRRKES